MINDLVHIIQRLVLFLLLITLIVVLSKIDERLINQQITELKSQITALTEALEKHDAALTTHDTKPYWWEAKDAKEDR